MSGSIANRCKVIIILFFTILTIVFVIKYSSVFRKSEKQWYDVDIKNGTTLLVSGDNNRILDCSIPKADSNEKCEKEYCFRKCCPVGQSLYYYEDNTHVGCLNLNRTLMLTDIPFILFTRTASFYEKYSLLHGLPCTNSLPMYEERHFSVSDTGVLFERNITENRLSFKNPSDYCIDVAQMNETTHTVISYICFHDFVVFNRSFFIYFSLVSFFLTFFVYAILPELRNTTHGLCLMSHTASLFIAYSLVAVKPERQILSDFDLYEDWEMFTPTWQMIIGYSYFIFYYVGFFWMNVICFDIWRTFRSMKPINSDNQNNMIDKKEFFCYSAYAWCTPFLLLAINRCFIGNSGIQFDECFIVGHKSSQCTYFYIPLTVILLVNMGFFIATIYTIKRVWKNADLSLRNERNDTNCETNYERFSVYWKLFIIMGIPYVLELVSFIFAKDLRGNFWYLADIVKSIQGLFVFILFVLKRRILKLLLNKFCPFQFIKTKMSTLLS